MIEFENVKNKNKEKKNTPENLFDAKNNPLQYPKDFTTMNDIRKEGCNFLRRKPTDDIQIQNEISNHEEEIIKPNINDQWNQN